MCRFPERVRSSVTILTMTFSTYASSSKIRVPLMLMMMLPRKTTTPKSPHTSESASTHGAHNPTSPPPTTRNTLSHATSRYGDNLVPHQTRPGNTISPADLAPAGPRHSTKSTKRRKQSTINNSDQLEKPTLRRLSSRRQRSDRKARTR